MVDGTFMNVEKFKRFKEEIQTMSQFNGPGDCEFLIIKKEKNEVKYANALSFMDLYDIRYLVVLCTRSWKQLGYTNHSLMLLGMFNSYFDVVKKIPCNNGAVVNVEFTKYRGSYYDEYKPKLIIEDSCGNLTEVELEEDGEGSGKDLVTLFTQVLAQ